VRNALRWLISRLANLTPGVVYYADGWPTKINEMSTRIEAQKGGKGTPLSTAAVSMACAAHEYIQVGDTATINLSGVTYRGRDVGHFIVTVKRVESDPTS
jgi:hypothetical protein